MYWGAGNLAECNTSGTLTSEYIFAGGKRIARRDISTGSVYYYFEDELGSSSVLATASGGVENESDYYPFGGEDVVTQNLTNQHYKFEGKERDPETGLDNFGARFSNPNMGRFMSPDWANSPEPIPYSKLDTPQSLNLYSFAKNNPESFPDLDGHEDGAPGGDAYNSSAGQAQLAFEEGGDPAPAAFAWGQRSTTTGSPSTTNGAHPKPKAKKKTHKEPTLPPPVADPNCPSGKGSKITVPTTGYDSGVKSTGKKPGDKGYGETRYGHQAKHGTIASNGFHRDRQIYVPGYGLGTVDDIGGMKNAAHIDLWFPSEAEANAWGNPKVEVTVCAPPDTE